MKIKLYKEPWSQVFQAAIFDFDVVSRKTWVAKPLELEEVDLGAIISPTFKLEAEDLTAVMDELWRNGVRPTEWEKMSTTDLGAHLRDMRRIAFSALKIEEPDLIK